MPFQPDVGDTLTIEDVSYQIATHPAAPGMPYGQEGRQGTVYQLVAPSPESGEPASGGRDAAALASRGQGGVAPNRALKVFKPRYRVPALVGLAGHIASFAELPGLSVCRRTVLIPQRHGQLLRAQPDLTYAVLMPWIEGPTWMEVMLDQGDLSPAQCLTLAGGLATVLSAMEQRSLAHSDLSGPNVLLPALAGSPMPGAVPVALVDVEQLYASGLQRPELMPGGSPGYAQHRTAAEGLWQPDADRFSGAVLLAEMLGWCDERVRGAAWGENYFDPTEMQQETERFRLLSGALAERWGEPLAQLFERAWRSETLADCPTFGEWLVTLPQEAQSIGSVPPEARAIEDQEAPARGLMNAARRLEQTSLAGALEIYRQALALAQPGSALAHEISRIIADLEERTAQPSPGAALSTAPTETRSSAVEADLARLFDEGLEAYRRGEWAAAKELLGEVVRRQPDYARGQRAARLLADSEQRLSPTWLNRIGWKPMAGGGAALILLGLGAVLFARSGSANPLAFFAATATPTPTAVFTATPTLEAPTPTPAPPTVTPSPAPPTATPTVDQAWQATLQALAEPWDRDWPRAIAMIHEFDQHYPGYTPADEKLYAALVAYGTQLARSGQVSDGVEQILRAQALLPDRGEARQALSLLTATPSTLSLPPVPNRRNVAGAWSSDFGPVVIDHVFPTTLQAVSVSGHWIQAPGTGQCPPSAGNQGCRGTITGGTFDPDSGVLFFTYSQPWNNQTGGARFQVSEDGRTLSGRWSHRDGPSGTWTMQR